MARAGLKKVVKTVRGKKGTVRRTYWVKTAAKVALGAAGLAGAFYAGRKLAQRANNSAHSLAIARAREALSHHTRNIRSQLPGRADKLATKSAELAGRGVRHVGGYLGKNAGRIGGFAGRTTLRAAKAAPGAAWGTLKFAGRFARGFYRGVSGQNGA